MNDEALGASFRDPSGFVYRQDGIVHRKVHSRYASHYDRLMSSGLYQALVQAGLLIPHEEVTEGGAAGEWYRTLRPEQVGFISYPYEWCFSQLKDAALATLRVQLMALEAGMVLKDASAYNVQFHRGRPLLIDTLSFETWQEGAPWVAYRQFCQHFLAPLALMVCRDVRLAQLLRVHIDGVPLDLARELLPTRAWLNIHLFLHLRMHASYQDHYSAGEEEASRKVRRLDRKALVNLAQGLETAVKKLDWEPAGTEWVDYYEGDSYTDDSSAHKQELVGRHLDAVEPGVVWDLGANTGVFSRLAASRGVDTLSFDVDPACVEVNYRRARAEQETHLLPLLLDLVNPSPALGWAHAERDSLLERSSADLVLALALIHHIAVSNNVPLGRLADYLAELGEHLVIEWVPKEDAKVRTLLATREDVFPHYDRDGFEAAFVRRFEIEEATPIRGSERVLYRMRRRSTEVEAAPPVRSQ